MGLDLRLYQVGSDGSVSLGIGAVPTFIKGIELLAQMVIIAYLENPGQDVDYPSEGSGVRTLIGQFDVVNEKDLKVEFLNRTTKIEQEIVARQAKLDIKSDEKLKKINIVSLNIDPTSSDLIASVSIENQANQQLVVRV
jgi:hypothetical protein